MPLSHDDSIIEELEDYLKDPLLSYTFEIPSEYAFVEPPQIDQSKANSKTVTHYDNDIVDVLSYGNNLTRIFPDGYRIFYESNGNIKLTDKTGRTIFFNNILKSTEIEDPIEKSKTTILRNGQFEKKFQVGTRFLRLIDKTYKLIRYTKDELSKTVEGKYKKRSRYGKISII